jgi:hypothetical protein
VRHCPSSKACEDEEDVVEDQLGSTVIVEKVVGSGVGVTELGVGVVTDEDLVAVGVVGSAGKVVVLSTVEVVLDVVVEVEVVLVDVEVVLDSDVDVFVGVT